MLKKKKYWRGLEELKKEPVFEKNKHKEFPDFLPFDEGILQENGLKADRRDFLKMFGFGMAAVSLASCEIPVNKAIPYLNKPEEITPGVANWYASTYSEGGEYCSILVKTVEGRPIKIEGNPLSDITQGGAWSRTHASVLDLYDITRLKKPLAAGNETDWETVDNEIGKELSKINANGGKVVILSNTIISPTTKKLLNEYSQKYPNVKHITYDAVSYSSMLNANKECFGLEVLPNYYFNKSNVIVSIGADFLGSWLNPIQNTRQFAEFRQPENKEMSRLVVMESNLSLTGANADLRLPVKPSQIGIIVLNLYNHIAGWAGAQKLNVDPLELAGNTVENTAKELWSNKGSSLVICGSNDPSLQTVVNAINSLLGNYGSTIDLDNPSYQKNGNDKEVDWLVKEMNNDSISGIIFYGANPVYNYPDTKTFGEGLKKVGLKISLSGKEDETAALCNYVCPNHHYLESWNDAEPVKGHISICQPAIRPIFKTRAAQETLLKWMGNDVTYIDYLKQNHLDNYYPSKNTLYSSFRNYWESLVHDGVMRTPQDAPQSYPFNGNLSSAHSKITENYSAKSSNTELVLYQKPTIGDGSAANNPWLQEIPDPISKTSWDNYAAISPRFAQELGVSQEDVVEIEANGTSVKLPVLIQPGQAYQTIAIAVGYGRTKAGKTADNVGQNAYPLSTIKDGYRKLFNNDIKITPTGEKYELAQTQTQHTLVGRPIIMETTLPEYKNNPASGNEKREKIKSSLKTLYQKFDPKGHHWAMVVDMNSCTGCSSCIVSCSAENNVPIVGKQEVKINREMFWLRIDRYYSASTENDHEAEAENPDVVFQPMLCQHCDNAPCENVCPVAATTHSSEGINQMAYNRCVGTRYCANNCPYKVRRFNWLDYADNDSFPMNSQEVWQGKESWGMTKPLPRMALNPDVIVRTRGVMEKCSFCIQRIQGAKLEAKKEGRNVIDGEVKTACQQSCPANAIKFGDLLDPNSEVSQLYKNERMYHVLEELHTLPSVGYLTKVRNREEGSKA